MIRGNEDSNAAGKKRRERERERERGRTSKAKRWRRGKHLYFPRKFASGEQELAIRHGAAFFFSAVREFLIVSYVRKERESERERAREREREREWDQLPSGYCGKRIIPQRELFYRDNRQ